MKAWVLYGPNDLRYEDIPAPQPEKGEVLVRVKAAGICGSDISRVFDTGAHRHPLIVGHEFSGVVEDIGQGVSKHWLNSRVGVFPLIPCRECQPCLQKKYEMCRNYNYLGSRCHGGFAEYVTVPAGNLIELPEGVSFEAAAMLEPMSVTVHAMRRGTGGLSLSRDAAIAVCGLGTIGILLTRFLLEVGYRNLYVIGNKEFQKKKIINSGISAERYCDSRGNDVTAWLQECAEGVDAFFECTGRNEVLSWAIDSTRPEGRVILVGNPCADMTLGKGTYWKILRNQLAVIGTWNSSFIGEETDDWHYVLNCLEAGGIAPAELITHRMPLDRFWEGLDIMRSKREDYCKIMTLQGE